MSLENQLVDALAGQTPGGYGFRGPHMSEPTAWAAMALTAAGRHAPAARACVWFSHIQQNNGSVGVGSAEVEPRWPTALALLAWHRWQQATGKTTYNDCIEGAIGWTLKARGTIGPRKSYIGHDTTLVGWSWAENTHSWLEPTAMFVRAGSELGVLSHPRFREAERLLVDRLLPSGGCNYGNTIVLGQELMPHVQPTGIVLWALSQTNAVDERIQRSVDYLDRVLDESTTTASLAFGIVGLSAYDRVSAQHVALLDECIRNELAGKSSTYKLALLTMATMAAKAQESTTLAGTSS